MSRRRAASVISSISERGRGGKKERKGRKGRRRGREGREEEEREKRGGWKRGKDLSSHEGILGFNQFPTSLQFRCMHARWGYSGGRNIMLGCRVGFYLWPRLLGLGWVWHVGVFIARGRGGGELGEGCSDGQGRLAAEERIWGSQISTSLFLGPKAPNHSQY